MLNRLKKASILFSTLIVLALVIIPFASALAISIDPPDSITLLGCNAYQDLIEEDDQLYLMYYNIAYTTYPSANYTVNDAFYVTLTNAGTGVDIALSDIFNNPYFHTGYGRGMVSMYFTASEASALSLTWSANYTMRMVANPSCNWTAAVAPVSQSVTWSGTGLTARLFYILNQLQNQWGVQLVDSGTLSTYGENYAISTIPNLRLMAPTIFGSYEVPIVIEPEKTHPETFALLLRNQWIGTWLDLTTVATDWGINAIWIYALIWLAAMVAVGWISLAVGNWVQGVQDDRPFVVSNTKPLLYVELLMIEWGGLMGFLPWLAAVLATFVLAMMIINQLFFSKATA